MKLFVAIAALAAVSAASPIGLPHPDYQPLPPIGLPNPFADERAPLVQLIVNVNQANKPIGPLPDKPLPPFDDPPLCPGGPIFPDKPLPPFDQPPPLCPGSPVAPDQPAVDPVIVVDEVPPPVGPIVDPVIVVDDVPAPVAPVDVVVPVLPQPAVNDPEVLN
ncbi:uncharacterized protein LOC142979882 [Anticarsia gemmatalis]|uniref:uncharacterized protein LOC142979882 n=1 Tax=Anticarsia gemmatalis TaxID=129554 RepID=UPI003F772720